MTTKTNYVKYINAQFILFLLQFTNNVFTQTSLTPIQDGNTTSFGIKNVGNAFNNGSTAAGDNKSTTESSSSVFSTRRTDLTDKKQSYRNDTIVKDGMKESKDKGLRNATKSLQFDSKKEKETAHIHIYTGL